NKIEIALIETKWVSRHPHGFAEWRDKERLVERDVDSYRRLQSCEDGLPFVETLIRSHKRVFGLQDGARAAPADSQTDAYKRICRRNNFGPVGDVYEADVALYFRARAGSDRIGEDRKPVRKNEIDLARVAHSDIFETHG